MKEFFKSGILIICIISIFYLWLHMDEVSKIEWKDLHSFISNKQGSREKKESKVIVTVTRQDGSVLKLSMNDYLYGVIGSEMPVSYELEALKAQCVAARTFVVQRNLQVDDTVQTQVYHDDQQLKQIWKSQYSENKKKVLKAIKETEDEIMTYQGKPISALFFSSSCGKTANAEEYWQNKQPYLKSVDSSWDQNSDEYLETIQLSEKEFSSNLGFLNPVSNIENVHVYKSGYIQDILIDGIIFSGREVREKLHLRSSCFTIKKVNGGYEITTKGYGHGVGMSQVGAQQMALKNYDYQEILHHYYTDVNIEKIDV